MILKNISILYGTELKYIHEAFESNWVAPLGPNVNGFENDLEQYVGQDSKLSVLESWCSELGLKMNEIAFIGDDRNDLKVMEAVGLAVCPASAVPAVKSIYLITNNK